MPIYEETSGTNPDALYDENSFRLSAWGVSWNMAWGFSWGFVPDTPFLDSSGSSPEDLYFTGSGSGATLYSETSGTSPEQIYEEN